MICRQARRFRRKTLAESAALEYLPPMLDRADSLRLQGVAPPAPAPFPAWARPKNSPDSEAEAAFLAGAALARLDFRVREDPPWAGAFRQRLALRAAAACVARSGRGEDEAALRDAFHLTRSGGDPGPAGRRLLAWRALTSGSASQWRSAFFRAAEVLEVLDDEALQAAVAAAEACIVGPRLAPFAAARAYCLARRALAPAGRAGEGDLLAAFLADAVLAQKLNWPFALPLLAEPLFSAAGRRAAAEVGEGAETLKILSGYARAAAQAGDLAGDLSRRAEKLIEAAPKLRAKGAGAALRALLDDDSLGASMKISGLSDRGARRLFDRLVALGAIRELTGRETFRLYGL